MGLITPDLAAVLSHFQLEGSTHNCENYGTGHIHDTYLVSQSSGNRYILQKFNHLVFKEPFRVMENLQLVLNHLQKKAVHHPGLQHLRVINTSAGQSLWTHPQWGYWRVFEYIDNSFAIDRIAQPKQAYEGAAAFGQFLLQLGDLPASKLHITIKDFHHIGRRFEQLQEAVDKDPRNRAAQAKSWIDFAQERQEQVNYLTGLIEGKSLPLRVTHNDTKISNVLFDKQTKRGVAVIDLDTIMPGLLMYDFGDMARTFCPKDRESGVEVNFRMEVFDYLCRGFFLDDLQAMLTTEEKESLKWGPWLMSYLMGVRFLADYINGDPYYKISYALQNLDRARNQLRLVGQIERLFSLLEASIKKVCG